MKQKLVYRILIAFFPAFISSCVNDEGGIDCGNPGKITLHVSVQDKKIQSRASDLITMEGIKRYDTFIYDTANGNLIDYKGQKNLTALDEFTAEFISGANYLTTKDVFVVVNNSNWDSNTEEQMKAITRNELEALEIDCNQNYSGTMTAMTDFGGYKKNAAEYEPFIMSVSSKAHDFQTTPKLELQLKRTYAKVILNIISSLPDGDDNADWVSLKNISVKRINNVPAKTVLFEETGTGYHPTTNSYGWNTEFNKAGNDADLKTGYVFDTFTEDNIKLRIFPQEAVAEAYRTSIEVGFGVGPAGKDRITKEFFRKIEIGKIDENYRIDPNCAYVITIRYGKTDSSLSVSTKVVPWYIVNFDSGVYPE